MASNLAEKVVCPLTSNQEVTITQTNFQTLWLLVMSNPVLAQVNDNVTNNASACVVDGLFSRVTNFVVTVVERIMFGAIEGGTLNLLSCQVIGFVTVGFLLALIFSIVITAWEVSRL